MGSAIMKGIAAGSLEAEVYAYDKDAEKLAAAPAKPCKSEAELVSVCKYVLLAVKPQVLGDVLDALKPAVTPDTVFISICAGISEKFIRSRTIPDAKVVLVMPNTPMMLGMGASAMSTDDKSCCGLPQRSSRRSCARCRVPCQESWSRLLRRSGLLRCSTAVCSRLS